MKNELWALVGEIALWGWVAAVIGMILHAFPSRDGFKPLSAAIWGGCFLVLYVIWVVGMVKA